MEMKGPFCSKVPHKSDMLRAATDISKASLLWQTLKLKQKMHPQLLSVYWDMAMFSFWEAKYKSRFFFFGIHNEKYCRV